MGMKQDKRRRGLFYALARIRSMAFRQPFCSFMRQSENIGELLPTLCTKYTRTYTHKDVMHNERQQDTVWSLVAYTGHISCFNLLSLLCVGRNFAMSVQQSHNTTKRLK